MIAAVFEAAGALIAGGEVVGTIRGGIIDPSRIADSDTFVWLMLAALLVGALWLNIATAVGAPVSTTHSIVGAVLGAGMAASGVNAVNWAVMGSIAASWVISPLMGGVIAAGFLYPIKRSITYKADMVAAARSVVPLLVALMAWAFVAYILLKGVSKIWKTSFTGAAPIGPAVAVRVYFAVKSFVAARARWISNTKQSVNSLLTVPMIFAAALLSFAHGSNDVANAVGPLAAIVNIVSQGGAKIGTAAAEIKAHHPEDDQEALDAYLAKFAKASVARKSEIPRHDAGLIAP